MTISWSFSCNSFVKLYGKTFGSHSMTVLYPKPCSRKVRYKGAELYKYVLSFYAIIMMPSFTSVTSSENFVFVGCQKGVHCPQSDCYQVSVGI